MEMVYSDIRDELRAGNRVLMLVRHAERPKIDQEDPTFGAALPLTPAGAEMATSFGLKLAGAAAPVQFAASPLRRTVMTAERIAVGMGLAGAAVTEDDELGNGSAFMADRLKVWESFRDGRFFAKMCDYIQSGDARYGFAPLAAAADAYEAHALGLLTAPLGIFATHDIFIVAYLHARGVKTDWCKENWPRFLDAAVLVESPAVARRYALLRAGLTDRIMGV